MPITEYFEIGSPPFCGRGCNLQYSAATRRWTAGPSFEWRIAHGLGIEAEVLYKRTGYVHDERHVSSASGEILTINYDVKKGSSWDFPIMLKYRFVPSRRPFVTGGYLLRHIGPVSARGTTTDSVVVPNQRVTTTSIDTNDPIELHGNRNFSGLTVGGGVEFRRGRLRLLPEFRYTGWVTNIGSAGNGLRLNPNQAEFLLGFMF